MERADHPDRGNQTDHHQRRGDDAAHLHIGQLLERRDNQKAPSHPQQSGDHASHRAQGSQGRGALGGPGKAPGVLVEHAVLLAPVGMAMIVRPGVQPLTAEHACGHQEHQQAEQDHQDFFRELMREIDAQWRKQRTQQGNQQRRAVTHQAVAQAVDGAHRRRAAHREPGHRRRSGHAPAETEHQCRHREDAATGPGQTQDQPHHHAKQTCQQHKTLVFQGQKPGAPGIDARQSKSRSAVLPAVMPSNWSIE